MGFLRRPTGAHFRIYFGAHRSPRGPVGAAAAMLVEQTATVDPDRLGDSVGYLGFEEMRCVDAALRIVLDLLAVR